MNPLPPQTLNSLLERVEIAQGDITRLAVDAIVNAANESLRGGGGVDGAIHRAAGPMLLAECQTLGGCPTGQARLTKGYQLPARWVIHTVGPVWQGGGQGEDRLLAACYQNTLELAARHHLAQVAFPAIATGAYGFPLARAVGIAITETFRFLASHDTPERVIFVCFSPQAEEAYREALGQLANC